MAILKYTDLVIKREDGWSSGGSGARWAFFGIFLVLVLFVVLGTLRANKKRAQQGAQPIYGTRWLTPPNYRQSQNQYNQPDHVRDPELPSAYVPTYTETANEYDMGFYDNQGEFHANPNAKAVDLAPPNQAHARDSSPTDRGPATDLDHDINDDNDHDDLFRRPSQFPPRRSTQTSTSINANIDPNTIGAPSGPPPTSTSSIPGAFPSPSPATTSPIPNVQQISYSQNVNFATRRF
ncbi:chitin synthesis regulation, resistance to congo red-domain-containing protein [Scheffersomyces coipomensis]|uniref:chitin synthesis regulation, resistance to congo red-domain-containing protein n=1 Tax=Scheffersomyces coipomensis TaxID=1788519 RepID=UPI00315DE51A